MSKLGWLITATVTGTLGFFAWQNHLLSERIGALTTNMKRVSDAPAPPVPSLASCYLSPMFAKQLANELRGTLAGAPDAEPSAAPAAEPAIAATEAADSANRALDEIIDRGRITLADVNKLRIELASATSEQRDHVRARIAAAINRDELVPEDPHALYP